MAKRVRQIACAAVLLVPWPGVARAEWDPQQGAWGKSHASDIRVMTWNVKDGIRSQAAKSEGFNTWTALARIVAAIRPDVLLLQEMGDNNSPGQVDSVATLTTVVDLFLHGGNDPYTAGEPPVTAYVQKYAPQFDMPHLFVSAESDGFNRNVLLARFAFGDLNGDNRSTYSDIPANLGHLYAPGGDGGIRGIQMAELDLPGDTYVGDLVVANAHLKSGGSSSDLADRLAASQNAAYVIDYWYNGAAVGVPDPHGAIIDFPSADTILDPSTPLVFGGDLNEDELFNGRRGPADWITQAQVFSGVDGTDKDRTDATYDAATHPFTGSRSTRGSSKLDYVTWQDSAIAARRAFVFNSDGVPSGSQPAEFDGVLFPAGLSGLASDHLPVVVDFIPAQYDDGDGDGDVDLADYALYQLCAAGAGIGLSEECVVFDSDGDDDVDLIDFGAFMVRFAPAP